MLRGAIDHVTSDRIGGWVYSDWGDVRNVKLLAFVDDVCVGAGEVDQFRQDLADAGLGDGFVGFNFWISPQDPDSVGKLIVRVEGSDAALIQRTSQVTGRAGGVEVRRDFARSMTQLEWMRSRGWLEQHEFDFLKQMNQIGVYDRSLRRSREADGAAAFEPEAEARSMFELLRLQEGGIIEQSYADVLTLAGDVEKLRALSSEPIIAIWAPKRGGIAIVEGGHDGAASVGDSLQGAIEYACGPDRLLFLDTRCPFGLGAGVEVKEMRVFLPGA